MLSTFATLGNMNITIKIHQEDGGYWAEVPSMPGCASQGDTYQELLYNIREAIEGWLLVDAELKIEKINKRLAELPATKDAELLEIAV